MSAVKTTQLDGDVSVGRNVAIGGRASVAGNVTISHNLKIEGYLEADNIKDTNKGVFATETALETAYPSPKVGWWALVGDESPFTLYRCETAGTWTEVTEGDGVDINVDLTSIEGAIDDLGDEIDSVADTLGERIGLINSKRFYDTTAENYSSEAVMKRRAIVLEMYVDGDPFESDNPLEFVSCESVSSGTKKRLYFMRRTASIWAFSLDVPADSGISIHSKTYSGRTIYFLIDADAPTIATPSNYHSSVIVAGGCYSLENNPGIANYLYKQSVDSQLETLTDDVYYDKPIKYTQGELNDVFLEGGYMDNNIRQTSATSYGLYLIPIESGEKIRVKIPYLNTLNTYNGIGFSTGNTTGSSITVISGKTNKENIDETYTATQDGYVCVWLNGLSYAETYEIYHYQRILIKEYLASSDGGNEEQEEEEVKKLLEPKFSKKIICSGSSITWGDGKLDNSMVLHVDNFIKNRLSTTILPADMAFSGDYDEVSHVMMYNGYGRKISTLNDTIEFDSYGDEIAICQMKRRTKTDYGIIKVYADDVEIGIFDNKNYIGTKIENFSGTNIREIRLKKPCTFNHQIYINNSSTALTNIIYNTAGYGGAAPSDQTSFEAYVFRALDNNGMPVHKIQFSTALGTITSVNITYDYGHIIAHERNTRGQTSDEYTNESYYGSGSTAYDPDHPTGGISSGIEFRAINKEAFFVHKFTTSKLRHFKLELIGGNNPYFIINFATNRYHDLMNAGIGGWTVNYLINDDDKCDYTQFYKWFKPEIIFQESETNDDWSYDTRRISRYIGEVTLPDLQELPWLEVHKVEYNSSTTKYKVHMCTGIIGSITYTSLISQDIVGTQTQVGDIIRIGNYHGDIKQVTCRKITDVNLTTGEVKWKEPLSVDEILNIDSLEELVGAEINIRDLSGYKAAYKSFIEKVHEISPEATVVVVDNGLPMLGVRQLWGYDVIHREIVNESDNAVFCDAREVLYNGQFDTISGLSNRKETFTADGSPSYDLSFTGAYKSWCGFKVYVNGLDVYGKDCYIESQYAYRAKSTVSGSSLNKSTPYYRSNATDNPGNRSMRLVFTKNAPPSGASIEVWYSDQIWSTDFCHPSSFGSYLYGQAYSKFIE